MFRIKITPEIRQQAIDTARHMREAADQILAGFKKRVADYEAEHGTVEPGPRTHRRSSELDQIRYLKTLIYKLERDKRCRR